MRWHGKVITDTAQLVVKDPDSALQLYNPSQADLCRPADCMFTMPTSSPTSPTSPSSRSDVSDPGSEQGSTRSKLQPSCRAGSASGWYVCCKLCSPVSKPTQPNPTRTWESFVRGYMCVAGMRPNGEVVCSAVKDHPGGDATVRTCFLQWHDDGTAFACSVKRVLYAIILLAGDAF
jgi:hypothetical protein